MSPELGRRLSSLVQCLEILGGGYSGPLIWGGFYALQVPRSLPTTELSGMRGAGPPPLSWPRARGTALQGRRSKDEAWHTHCELQQRIYSML